MTVMNAKKGKRKRTPVLLVSLDFQSCRNAQRCRCCVRGLCGILATRLKKKAATLWRNLHGLERRYGPGNYSQNPPAYGSCRTTFHPHPMGYPRHSSAELSQLEDQGFMVRGSNAVTAFWGYGLHCGRPVEESGHAAIFAVSRQQFMKYPG
jgi:hypothetical protein